ncbi:XdhC family protein [Bacillus massiliigorillae]|uniref:XdhC family protein n=1 Tax=Bacillus massiliigorillae TaxID=1243664 RepID=UPI00039F4CA9|nr:XdhC family protein [Bacillus massiliigorillae]
MEDIYRILDVIEDPKKKVLATIIHVEGSAYKKEGSSMLFFEDEKQIGMLSAGCLEIDLAIQAQEVLQKQMVISLQYDMSEETDLAWGQGAGCNGKINILLEPVTEQLHEDLILVKKLLASNKTVSVLKKYESGEYLFIPMDGEPFGRWSGQIPDIDYSMKSGVMGAHPIFQHTYQPKPRLIVFGAGPDAIPLVSLAAETGFSVSVYDWREELCQKKNFPVANQLFVGSPADYMKNISFSYNDFVLIMTHHFQHDQKILLSLINKRICYLGVLGPKERTKRLLMQETIPNWIHSPVGKSIGAKGPVEIAISVVAEMIEVWRKSLLVKE